MISPEPLSVATVHMRRAWDAVSDVQSVPNTSRRAFRITQQNEWRP